MKSIQQIVLATCLGTVVMTSCQDANLDVLTAPGHCSAGLIPTGLVRERARPSNAFLDSIGLNIRFYNKPVQPLLKPRLAALGVRHLIDEASSDLPALIDLATVGARSQLWIHGNTDVAKLLASQGDSLEALQFGTLTPPGMPTMIASDWTLQVRTWMKTVRETIRVVMPTRSLPLVSTSFNVADAAAIGSLGSLVDFGAFDLSFHGGPPDAIAMRVAVARARDLSSGKGTVGSQVNFSTVAGPEGVSETVQAKYVPRALAELFDLGVTRSYVGHLVDWSFGSSSVADNLGLLRGDGSPKPAYAAEQNLIRILDTDDGGTFEPGDLPFAVSRGPASLRHLLLQHSNGTFIFLLWLDVASTDADVSEPVKLKIGVPIGQALFFDPQQSATVITRLASPAEVDVLVPDHVVLVELRPDCTLPAKP